MNIELMGTRKLPAGRIMDALVAEKVMGWHKHVVSCGSRTEEGYGVVFMDDRGWPGRPLRDGESYPMLGEAWALVPAYSTGIDAAWQVVKRLIADGETYFAVECMGGVEWVCVFRRFTVDFPVGADGEEVEYVGEADTEALAICRAALRMMGG